MQRHAKWKGTIVMKKYIIGNWLRGYFEGNFENMQEAWSFLSNRLNCSWDKKDFSELSRLLSLDVREHSNRIENKK